MISYLHSLNVVTVWGGVLCKKIIGPIFFNRSLTGISYIEHTLGIFRLMCIQPDCAPPQNVAGVRNFLNKNFPNRRIE